ncbi:TlpA disulfide reductase family protein [Pedobacter sp. MC2016-24]|uniref:TlpA family protein disulfide reductase n=1 Tax=Pedobacter sp. MC2016-24 TaxID=2780090 RepID=UPI001881BF44|nr:TlpA disulfide reductase family protein [Pedobacter sp. MC2016-24]MBE9601862.1 TlpA family protein disulfide reductase [Pedobacter sp. MC2016-24]
MMKILKLIFLLICMCKCLAYSQELKSNHSTIIVKFHYQRKKIPDSLAIWAYPNANYWENSVDYLPTISKQHEFIFKLPLKCNLLNYRVQIINAGNAILIGNYYATPGDLVKLDIYETTGKDSLVFSGNGSAKYKLIAELTKIEETTFNALPNIKKGASSAALSANLKSLVSILQHETSNKYQLIIKADPKIGKVMKEVIGYHYANYDIIWADRLMHYWNVFKNDTLSRHILTDHFNAYDHKFLDESAESSVFSNRHFQYLLLMLRYGKLFNQKNGTVDMKGLYDVVKGYAENIKIKDRLLCEFFLTGGGYSTNYKVSVFDSLIKDASPSLISPLGREFIATNLLFKKGSKLFEGEFIDLKGNRFIPADLKGKVFLIDVWGEGCGACVMFHDWFEANLWPELKNIKDFVVLSIFDGKTKQDWQRGIASKRFTSTEYVNVSDMPLRMADHPFFKHYNVNYAPLLLLIDKNGNIIQKLNGNITKESFMKLVKEAIEAPDPI